MVDVAAVEKGVARSSELEAAQRLCLCPGCPAYPEEDRGKKLAYCLRGDSPHKESIDPKDCLCEMCEVYKGGKLYGRNFFCLEGAALEKGLRGVLAARPLFVSSGRDVREGP